MGNYLLLKKIARGGMGEIFLACDLNDDSNQLLVIKLLRSELATDKAFVEMLTDEANVVRNLSHLNIVGFHDFDVKDGHYCLVLEYVHGGTLKELLGIHKRQSQKLDLAIALHILRSLCNALSYAHQAKNEKGENYNLVHRDVTPSNLLLSDEGDVKLTDFGLVRAKGRMTETMPGIMKGSFGYMAPEVMTYDEIDHRADVFALGVVGFELFCNSKPTEDHSVSDYLSVIESKSFPKPSQLNPHVPPQLDEIIMRALESDREKRWQSAGEMREQVEQLIKLWKTSWPEVDTGKSRLAALVKHVVRGANEPAISDSEIDTLRRAANRGDMLSEGTLTPRAVSSPEPIDGDRTLVRAVSSPELKHALNEMVAAPRPMRVATVAVSGTSASEVDSSEPDEDDLEETDETLVGHTDERGVVTIDNTRIDDTAERSLDIGETFDQIKVLPNTTPEHSQRSVPQAFRSQLSATDIQLEDWSAHICSRKSPHRFGDIISSIKRAAGVSGVCFYELNDQSESPGLFTAQSVSIIDSCLAQSASLSAGMNWANHLLSSRLGSSKVSCLYLQVDPASSRLEYCNLGYPAGFFYMSARDELFAMTGRDAGIGLEAVTEGVAQSLVPSTGDTVVILSRGVIEAKNSAGEDFGWQRAQSCLTSNLQAGSEDILKAFDDAVQKHCTSTSHVQMDQTMAVLKKL